MIDKKGEMSPLVATVLILGITVAMSAVIMVLGNNFINGQRQESNNQVIEDNYVEGLRFEEFKMYVNNCRDFGGVLQRKKSIAYGDFPREGGGGMEFVLYDEYGCYGGKFPNINDYEGFKTSYRDVFFEETYKRYKESPADFMIWYFEDETYTTICNPTFVMKDGEETLITYCNIDRVILCGNSGCDLTSFLIKVDNIRSYYEFYDIGKKQIENILSEKIQRENKIIWT